MIDFHFIKKKEVNAPRYGGVSLAWCYDNNTINPTTCNSNYGGVHKWLTLDFYIKL